MTAPAIIVLSIGFAACATDLTSRRIPNLLTFGAALAAVVFHVWTNGVGGLFVATTGWMTGVAFFVLPFSLGGLGAGDVKLIAAIGAWLGPGETFWLGLYSCMAGGILAIAVALAHGYLREAFVNVRRLFVHWRTAGFTRFDEVSLEGSTGPRLAYAVPVFVGTVVTLWLR